MLAIERQKLILDTVNSQGRVLVSKMSEEIGVSVETIRHDIALMDRKGLLKQVHGGAVSRSGEAVKREASYAQRRVIDLEERMRIAARAAQEVEEGDIIVIGIGVTADELAKVLPGSISFTAFTNSISVLNILIERKNRNDFQGEIYLLGGRVFSNEFFALSEVTYEMLRNYSFDKAFLTATTICESGAMMSRESTGNYTWQLMQKSSQRIMMVSSSKIGHRALYQFCSLSDLDVLITDNKTQLSDKYAHVFQESKVRLIFV